jgi:hypothetical protein
MSLNNFLLDFGLNEKKIQKVFSSLEKCFFDPVWKEVLLMNGEQISFEMLYPLKTLPSLTQFQFERISLEN